MMTATIAAKQMQAERGYVVTGFPPGTTPESGRYCTKFAGQSLDDCHLVMHCATDRADWETQAAALFGSTDKARTGDNAPRAGEQFFRCSIHPGRMPV